MRWDLDPTAFTIGPFSVRWYGLLFAVGMFLSLGATLTWGRARGLPKRDVDPLVFTMLVSGLLGSHLGHLVFYEPSALLDDPARLFRLGRGLSSHGAAFGLASGTWIFCRLRKLVYWPYIDLVMLGVTWTFPFVRIGNFMNSEIVGRVSDVPWAVIFVRAGDELPRHPIQLYEALECVGIIVLAIVLQRHRGKMSDGLSFFIVLGSHFLLRSLLEVFKEPLVVDDGALLTMGQILSVPLVLFAAVGIAWRVRQSRD